jgi:hypothetical protein
MITRLVAEWFLLHRPRHKLTKKVTWDNIEPPDDIREWHTCSECFQKFPFVLHPNFGIGLIAHIKEKHGLESGKKSETKISKRKNNYYKPFHRSKKVDA